MNLPLIRLVCTDCLRSVEGTPEGMERPPDVCPYCGGAFESRVEPAEVVGSSLLTPVTVHLPALEPDSTQSVERPSAGSAPWVVGRFQIRETVGGGGFGRVHRAYDPRLDRDVALKILKPTHNGSVARAMERFFREARAAARLDHPNIVTLHDAGRDEGLCWIAYQYVPGCNLARYQEMHPLDFEAAVRIVRALADALDHAHRRGVFHRDLKPSNVLIDLQGQPRLTDFGLAKRRDYEATLTREGTVLGTPAYMSPEQAEGRSHQADARSDLYSLGVVLYELLCGRRPVELPSSAPVWRAAQAPPPPPPRSVSPAVPAELDRICRCTLARDPDDRYPDARSLVYDLDHWLERPQRSDRRARFALGLAAGLLLALPLSLALAAWLDPQPRPTPGPGLQAGHEAKSTPRLQPRDAPAPAPPPHTAPDQGRGPIVAPAPPAPAAGAADRKPAAKPTVVLLGNLSSRVYHRDSCPSTATMREKHRVTFATSQEAQARGYIPCSRCQPPLAGNSTSTSTSTTAPPGPHSRSAD